jgi:hypothetical protein
MEQVVRLDTVLLIVLVLLLVGALLQAGPRTGN